MNMKVVFVQKTPFPQIGIMSLSAFIKSHGYQVELLIADEEKDLLGSIKKVQPDLAGITIYTGEHRWAVELCRQLKRLKIRTVLGGPHPTYYPEIIEQRGVEIISRGESEGALLDLLFALEQGKSIKRIKNLWVKEGGKIYRNQPRNLIADLDMLPLPDREIYYVRYSFLAKVSVKQFLTGRGCPYRCTFCSNHLLRKFYQRKGKYLRRSSPKKVIKEIISVKERYGLKTVSFTDDVFAVDWDWLERFVSLYRKKVKIPFMCNLTANLVTDKLIRKLKSAGCYGISMGIESGNEKIRTKVLKKYITNDQILNAGKIIKKHDLVLKTYNILCLPGEEIQQALETIEINAKIKPDQTSCSFLQPFPKYEITQYAKQRGYLDKKYDVDDYSGSIYYSSPIKSKTKKQLENLQTFFLIGVKFPQLIPLIKILICFPPNPFYRFVARSFYGFYMSRVHRLTLSDMIRYAPHINPFNV